MRRWIWGSLLLAACGGLQAAAPAGSNADIAPFMDGRRFVSRLDADVTGDGVPDIVFVAANDDRLIVTVTVLARLHRKTLTGQGRMEGLDGIDSLQLELTPLGPPTVTARKGVLIIESLTGGATVRTAASYRYRFDPDESRMRLIGLDAERKSSTFGIKMSWNVLTGARIVRRSNPDGEFRYGRETRTRDKPSPIYMSLTPNPEELLDKALGEGPAR